MTDLEDLWDDLPVGRAPVEAILARGRRAGEPERRLGRRLRRRLGRSVYVVATVGAIAAAFVVGTMVDGSGGGTPGSSTTAPDAIPAAFHGALQAPASCDDLLAHYVDRAVKLVGPTGWNARPRQGVILDQDYDVARRGANFVHGAIPGRLSDTLSYGIAPTAGKVTTSRSVPSATGTNVQEDGVDEPDIVKTDGRLLVRIHQSVLTVYDVSGRAVEVLGDLDMGDLANAQLLLAGDRVVVLSSTDKATRVDTIDISHPAHPDLTGTVSYGAPLAAARQTGNDVRLILQSAPLPKLDFVHPEGDVSTDDAKAANVKAVRDSTLADWLPQLTVGDKTSRLLDCGNVAIPRADLGLGTMAVVGFDASHPSAPQAIGLAGQAPVTYESTDHLFLAATPAPASPIYRGRCCDVAGRIQRASSGDGTTYLYDFRLDGVGATYAAAGEVDGIVSNRWSMDESKGVLRVAVAPSAETGNFTSIVTLHRKGDQLLELGRLDGLGRGEQMQSVRWFDGLALLVTYQQRDPLYAVDLTDQAHPRLIGKLSLSGFSSYLQPLGEHRVIGMGQGPVADHGWGAQAGLFDTTNPAKVRRLDVVRYQSGSSPRAAEDPRQFVWLPHERVALTVISHGKAGVVSTIHLADGQMSEHRVAAEYGADVADLRVVAVPALEGSGDRVLLVTGEKVSFFGLGLQ